MTDDNRNSDDFLRWLWLLSIARGAVALVVATLIFIVVIIMAFVGVLG